MHGIDYSIIVIYLFVMVLIGVMAKKKAEKGIDAYFLGGRQIPWWMLGMSGMASNLDITGTMICTAVVYMLGVSGMLVEIRGGVVLILAILMVFMGKWYQRSGAMTIGHWMEFRFGNGTHGKWARAISAIAALVLSIGMVTYFSVGAGKFVASFLEIPGFFGLPPHIWGALIMISMALIYTVSSGLFGVIFTDLFQSGFIFIGIVSVSAIAFISYGIPETFTINLPLADGTQGAFEMTKAQWSQIVPSWKMNFPAGSEYANLNLFGFAIMFYVLKVIIEGFGGATGYMAQRYFAVKTEREAGLMSLLWVLLISLRWPFIVGLATMGIWYTQNVAPIADPEQVMPLVIKNMLPIGLKGLLVAALMAAAMSTFDSTINAGASYWVKDIYQAFINPNASEKKLISHSRWSSILIVATGLLIGIVIKSINDIWGWLMMSMAMGILVPLMVRWYWWRLNGFGFSMGTIMGMVMAVISRLFFPDASPVFSFCLVGFSSLAATIIFSLLTPATPKHVLENFYKRTRPFGFWGPIRNKLNPELVADIKHENRLDLMATLIAIPWQLALFVMGMVFMMKDWESFSKALFVVILLSVGLYFLWFKRLSKEVIENVVEEKVPAL